MAFKMTRSRPVLLQSTRLIRTARAGKSCAVAGLSDLYKDERPGVSLAERPEYNRAITARRFHAAQRLMVVVYNCGNGLARDAADADHQIDRVDTIASKPAPTERGVATMFYRGSLRLFQIARLGSAWLRV